MKRVVAAWALCILALVVGLTTAALSAHNRARGDELDRLERWCEAQSRRNELLRVDNQRREWRMLGSLEDPCAPAGDAREGAAVP
jgi:hypothetical protein